MGRENSKSQIAQNTLFFCYYIFSPTCDLDFNKYLNNACLEKLHGAHIHLRLLTPPPSPRGRETSNIVRQQVSDDRIQAAVVVVFMFFVVEEKIGEGMEREGYR